MSEATLIDQRRQNLAAWREAHPNLLKRNFSHAVPYAVARGAAMTEIGNGSTLSVAGRLVLFRTFGKLAFGQIQHQNERFQIALTQDKLGKDFYNFLLKRLDLGDFVGVTGEPFKTKTGEPTIRATEVYLLSKALRPLPEKHAGLQDEELLARKRYLDLATNPQTYHRFEKRWKAIASIEHELASRGFTRVETPILQQVASGASARPFQTRHNALDSDLYMRIAPEIALKMAMVGGYEAVFEIGKNFRNEGVDSSHLQEFTMCEFYRAYWEWADAMRLADDVIRTTISRINDGSVVNYQGQELQFGDYRTALPCRDYRELIRNLTNIDIDDCWDDEAGGFSFERLRSMVDRENIRLPRLNEYASFGSLLDAIYKREVRPTLTQPVWIAKYPCDLAPLASPNAEDPRYVDKFQLVVAGMELVNGYTELIDPDLQRERLVQQQKLAARGNEETVALDEEFLIAMEHGMPPMAGVGIGIDRLVALLTDSLSVRDVVLFPNVRIKR